MIITIVAAHLKTESGDDYLFLYDQVSGPEEFVQMVEFAMGDELAYVCSTEVRALYEEHDEDEYEQALRNRIEEMNEECDHD